jgi:hypothetical protein
MNAYWKPDAANQKFSYSKMVDEWNKHHFIDETKFSKLKFGKRYPCCMQTGWFSCRNSKKVGDANSQSREKTYERLGLGIALYFKQIKSLAVLFLILTLISLPTFLVYYGGSEPGVPTDSKTLFSTFTLGNIGQIGQNCYQADVKDDETFQAELFCGFGLVSKVDLVLLTDLKGGFCDKKDIEGSLAGYDSQCAIQEQLFSQFEKDCVGKKQCAVTMQRSSWQNESCRLNQDFVVVAECEASPVTIPFTSKEL